eukprot:GHVU01146130.1.p3 GENE.GHVU01146130.1~~GHVU01146130.1.p3  ORF type:complete len:100 (-),score=2.12 GHVU01146130.1:192-491(-)
MTLKKDRRDCMIMRCSIALVFALQLYQINGISRVLRYRSPMSARTNLLREETIKSFSSVNQARPHFVCPLDMSSAHGDLEESFWLAEVDLFLASVFRVV